MSNDKPIATVTTGSRLHFGLLSLGVDTEPAGSWPGCDGRSVVPGRSFGGVGLMIRDPGIRVSAQLAESWSAEGVGAARALEFGKNSSDTPCRIVVHHCAPEHSGLGTGTQLALATAYAVRAATGGQWPDVEALARLLGRGRRSALGVHGFRHGGFLVEGGKAVPTEIGPLLLRAEFPEAWRVVLAIPAGVSGLHGTAESQVFASSAVNADLQQTDALCRLTLLGILPALHTRDLSAFGAALYDFNRRAGEMFCRIQGGCYANPLVREMVAFVRHLGVAGVGQSSWGPTTFAVVEAERADWLRNALRQRFGLRDEDVLCTTVGPGATLAS